MVITFREPQGIRKIFKRKKDVTLKILEPIETKKEGNIKQRVENLKQETYVKMRQKVSN